MQSGKKELRKQIAIPLEVHEKIGHRIAEIRLLHGRNLSLGDYVSELVEKDWKATKEAVPASFRTVSGHTEGLGGK